MNRPELPWDIAVVGLGINAVHQTSREVEETIRRCRQTFVIDVSLGVVDYLKTLCPSVTDLMPKYSTETHRRLIYRRMASEVVAAATQNAPVCFATYGHPKTYCHPTTLIQRTARVLGLKVEVLAGISSLDTLLIDLDIDPGVDGLQVYDATDVVVRRRPLQTDVSCVIMQAPIVLEAYNRRGAPAIDNLRLLQNYLAEFYPLTHDVVLVISKTHPLLESIRQSIPLGKLASSLATRQGSLIGTLFIPPLKHREVMDQKLADRMKLPGRKGVARPGTTIPRRSGRPPIGPRDE
ncbi:MAG TPA: SAM-dependent methyltransferase [Vicinamibacterales bacterium]|nr:SAM-dependent methyltransferase [Vicinamibacterales bacterium]